MAVQVVISPSPVQHFVDNNGVALVGGQLFVYAAGTTTKITTYVDPFGETAQTNPIVMNSRGEPQNSAGDSVGIWVPPGTAYKLVLAPANDTDPPTNPFWTINGIVASSGGAATRATRQVTVASGPLQLLTTDNIVEVINNTGGTLQVLPPASRVAGNTYTVKDVGGTNRVGNASTYPIQFTGTIDGVINPVLVSINAGWYNIYDDGTYYMQA